MNEHVTPLLNAYHDGELSGRKLRSVEAHLETCAECLTQLEQLQSLSVLLQSSPVADDLLSSDVFVAQVGMRLPRKPEGLSWKKVSRTGWNAIPFGLLGTWAIVQAVFIVTNVVMLALQVIPGAEQILSMLPSGGSSLGLIADISGLGLLRAAQIGTGLLGSGNLLGWSIIVNVGLTLLIGLLYWSWLASWWIRNPNGNQILNGAS